MLESVAKIKLNRLHPNTCQFQKPRFANKSLLNTPFEMGWEGVGGFALGFWMPLDCTPRSFDITWGLAL